MDDWDGLFAEAEGLDEAADDAACEAWAREAGWGESRESSASESTIVRPGRGPVHTWAEDDPWSEAKPRPPTVAEVIGRGEAHYTFVPIFSRMERDDGVYRAKFWVLDDAVKWKVPNASSATTMAAAADWERPDHDDVMALKHERELADYRRRLWRLPCSARHGEDAARLVKMRQSQLQGAEAERRSRWGKRSLQITAHLYNLRYQQADLKIRPQTGLMTMNANQGLIPASVEYNHRVNAEADRVFNSSSSGPRLFPELMADPGKVWVIDRKMGKVRKLTCEDPPRPTNFRQAVNHGWHKPGGKRIQNRGTCHGASHIDYSQICMLVAGWCEVKKPGKDPKWFRTWRVYRSRKYSPLVTGGGERLKKIRYDW